MAGELIIWVRQFAGPRATPWRSRWAPIGGGNVAILPANTAECLLVARRFECFRGIDCRGILGMDKFDDPMSDGCPKTSGQYCG